MRLRPVSQVILIAAGLLLASLLTLLKVQQPTLAQGQVVMTKTLDKTGNVVRVGEVLSFTIALTNNSSFTLTKVTVVDNFDQSVLAFARSVPPLTMPPDGIDPVRGVITWSNVATSPFPWPTIGPGQNIRITVVFTAEHPKATVVNAARAQDLVSSAGSLSQTAATSRTQEAIGGSAPIFKALVPPGRLPQAGLPVTFTHLITNDGAAILTRLPLSDTYDPNFLQFNFAIPSPTLITPPGRLVWTDLTSDFGDIPPFATVVVTTVFTATTQVVTTVNRASTAGAADQFDNDLAAGAAQVPIVIIAEAPTPIPGPAKNGPAKDSDDDDDDDTATAPAPFPTTTPTGVVVIVSGPATATIEGGTTPQYLPETGLNGSARPCFWLIGLAILAVSGFIWIIYRQLLQK
jgi:uncharacterized repeat protein (TIGR01451 family)